MAKRTASLILLASAAMAQSILPSNDTLPVQADQLDLIFGWPGGMTSTTTVAPLTLAIGLGQTQTTLNVWSFPIHLHQDCMLTTYLVGDQGQWDAQDS
jgi:hypothetical protein